MPPSPPLTHFLCIPLVTPASKPQLQASLSKFKAHLSSLTDLPDGLLDRAVRPLGTLHLTLGVMSLLTPEKVEEALSVLRSLDLKTIVEGSLSNSVSKASTQKSTPLPNKSSETQNEQPPSLSITLQGLVPMQAPQKTTVLYAPPLDPTLSIYNFCLALKKNFSDAGLIIEDSRPLLLHATILNTVYAKPSPRSGNSNARGNGRGRGRKERITVDARDLIEEFEEMKWMVDGKVEKVAICRMGAKKVEEVEGEDTGLGEEYVVEGSVNMP